MDRAATHARPPPGSVALPPRSRSSRHMALAKTKDVCHENESIVREDNGPEINVPQNNIVSIPRIVASVCQVKPMTGARHARCNVDLQPRYRWGVPQLRRPGVHGRCGSSGGMFP